MSIKVNGIEQPLPEGQLSIADLLTRNNVQRIDTVAVQINGTLVHESDLHQVVARDGDKVEFLYFLGGGALR